MRLTRKPAVAVAAAIMGMTMLAAGSVQAGAGNTVFAENGLAFVPSQSLHLDYRFSPMSITVKSGSTLTLKDALRELPKYARVPGQVEEHTLMIVKPGQVPNTLKEAFVDCNKPAGACFNAFIGHFGNGPNNPPTAWIVDTGKPGINQPGDSLLVEPLNPDGSISVHDTTSATVTAPAGTTLHFICALHDWMQGTLTVR